jgi:putative CocE/NonD family hydrolase
MRLLDVLTRPVSVRRGFAVRARDGAILRTDHYAPRGVPDAPTVLVRTPYGRGGLTALAARLFAVDGFHVIVSSCRGTGGSSGRFDPMRHERDDGLDTVEWLRRQPWFTGRLGTFGVSYVGYTQWAIADVPEIAAMVTAITSSQFREPTYSGESFALYTTLAWASLIQAQAGPWLPNAIELLRGQPRLARALTHLPLGEADQVATGAEVEFFRRWLALAGGVPEADEYWSPLDHQARLGNVTAPVLMVGGWHDIFLPWQLRDYARLRAAGAQPHLTIGPWTHGSLGLMATTVRDGLAWLRTHLRGDGPAPRSRPVRLHVSGDGWRDYDDWPPSPDPPRPWYPDGSGRLTPAPPRESTVDSFRYDPDDPTPSVGGPLLVANVAGPRDNRDLEARPDVLVYTGEPLADDLDAVGPVTATVHVRASRPHFDLFVRLCDVEPDDGASVNVCDGLARVRPGRFPVAADGTVAVGVELWPAGHRFLAGHRLRLQVSGGAFPRYPRGSGTPDPLASAVDHRPVEIEVHHDHDHPTALYLP